VCSRFWIKGAGAGSVTSALRLSLGLARVGVTVCLVCPPGSEVERLGRTGGLDVEPLPLRARARLANAEAVGRLLARRPVAGNLAVYESVLHGPLARPPDAG